MLVPVMTDLALAPESLLKFRRRKCKLKSSGTNICSCRKNGQKCVRACRDCRGESSKNAKAISRPEEESRTNVEDELN